LPTAGIATGPVNAAVELISGNTRLNTKNKPVNLSRKLF